MIGLDTNVLVRYLVADDARQLALVDRLIDDALEHNELLHLDRIVLCETVWVLVSVYKYDKHTVIRALERILKTRQFSIDHRELVVEALDLYRRGKGDFSDHLIGRANRETGCRHSVSFDKALRGTTDFHLLGPKYFLAKPDEQDDAD